MNKSFLPNTSETPAIGLSSTTATNPTSNREAVKILIMGSPKGVTNTIQTLYRLGFAQVTEWSPLQPTANPREVVSILIRQMLLP